MACLTRCDVFSWHSAQQRPPVRRAMAAQQLGLSALVSCSGRSASQRFLNSSQCRRSTSESNARLRPFCAWRRWFPYSTSTKRWKSSVFTDYFMSARDQSSKFTSQWEMIGIGRIGHDKIGLFTEATLTKLLPNHDS